MNKFKFFKETWVAIKTNAAKWYYAQIIFITNFLFSRLPLASRTVLLHEWSLQVSKDTDFEKLIDEMEQSKKVSKMSKDETDKRIKKFINGGL